MIAMHAMPVTIRPLPGVLDCNRRQASKACYGFLAKPVEGIFLIAFYIENAD
jgi:hypothetical protein